MSDDRFALYAPGGNDRRLHVAWGAVGPFGRRWFLTLEPSGTCNIEQRDLQDTSVRNTWRLDFANQALRSIWQAVDEAGLEDRSITTEATNGDFIEIAVASAGKAKVTLLRNAYHRPTLAFIGLLNGFLFGDVRVTYSFLNPAVLQVLAVDR